MHSGSVFWGTKEELRAIMTVLEQTDVQVQMFEREEGDWALHVNFAGASVSRLALENGRLATLCAELTEAAAAMTEAMKGHTRVTRALHRLVLFKDSPRDEVYLAVWDEARAALAALNEDRP